MTSIQDLGKLVGDLTQTPTVESPAIKTFDKRGRGRKQCPKCKVIIGVRNKVCSCGHKFVAGEQKQKRPRDSEVDMGVNLLAGLGCFAGKDCVVLYAPQGEQPVKFKGDVVEWASNTAVNYFSDNKVVTPCCLRYLLRRAIGFPSIPIEETQKRLEELRVWIEETSVDFSSEIFNDETN